MLCLMLIQNLMCSGIPLFFASRGFSTSFAGLLGLPFALFGILARTTGGYLMDRFGRRVIMILGPLLMGIASLLFLLLPFAPLMLLFRGLHGEMCIRDRPRAPTQDTGLDTTCLMAAARYTLQP